MIIAQDALFETIMKVVVTCLLLIIISVTWLI